MRVISGTVAFARVVKSPIIEVLLIGESDSEPTTLELEFPFDTYYARGCLLSEDAILREGMIGRRAEVTVEDNGHVLKFDLS